MATPSAKRCAEAAETLRELLVTAASRGISIEDSFAHFDHGREGVIDLSQFVLGLRSLGIPVSVEVGSLLLFQISEKSSTHLTCNDFHRLVDPSSTLYSKRKIKPVVTKKKKRATTPAQPPPTKRRKRPSRITTTHDITRDQALASAQGLPQWAHDRSKRALKELQHLAKKRPFVPKTVLAPDDDRDSSEDDSAAVKEPNQASPPRPSTATIPHLELHSKATNFSTHVVDKDSELQYVIFDAPPMFDAPSSSYGEDLAAAQSRVSRHLDTAKARTSVRAMVVLDAFQTIEMMEALLQPFFHTYPAAKVLVVGHPSKVATDTVLTNATLAQWMGSLLLQLLATRAWSAQPKHGPGAVPQLLLGCGSGASVACYFSLITAPENPKLHVLSQSLSALVLLNGFCHVDSALKSKLHPLLHGLPAKGDTECHEQIAHLLFSDGYLHQCTREGAMTAFFEYRHDFLSQGNRGLLLHRLKGVAKYQDIRPVLRNLDVPLILLHGSQNGWVQPSMATAFQEHRVVVTSIAEAFQRQNSIYTAWLKAGHELLQERSSFSLQFIDSVVAAIMEHMTLASAVKPTASPDDNNSEINDRRTVGARARFDLVEEDPLVVQAKAAPAFNLEDQTDWSPRVKDIYNTNGIKGVRQELIDRFIDLPRGESARSLLGALKAAFDAEDAAHEAAQTAKARLAAVQEAQHEEMQRLATEKQQKLQRDQARKKQRLKKEEADFTSRERERMRIAAIAEFERRNRQSMDSEDECSRKREDYDRKCVQWEESNRIALLNVAELKEERSEALQTQIEINLGLERAAHRAALQAQLWELQRNLEANQVTLRGDTEGYALECGVESSDIPRVLQGIACVLHDATAVRNQKKLNLTQQTASTAKYATYNSQLQECSRSHSNLVRALHRAETENVIAKPDSGGAVRLVPATPSAIRALREKIQTLNQEMTQFQAMTSSAMEEVTMFDRAMQSISILQHRTETVVNDLNTKAALMITNANEELSSLREAQEMEIIADSKRLHATHTTEARVNVLTAELQRMQHIHTKMVDSSIYIAGTLQRVDKATLERMCTEELATLSTTLEELRASTIAAKSVRADLRTNIKRVVENLAQLLSAHKQLIKFQHFFQSTTVKAELENDERSRGQLEASAAAARLLLDVPDAAIVRTKKLFEHTLEEKEWVALDVKLGTPYSHLSERQTTEMHMDPLYQTLLSTADLEYILSLPSRINLALPFIKSHAHLRAHYLLRKYTCGDGETVLNAIDKQYTTTSTEPRETSLATILQRKLGESLRLKPWASCTEKEQLWLACDARLRPSDTAVLLPPFPSTFPAADVPTEAIQQIAAQAWSPNFSPMEDSIWCILHEYGGLHPDAQHIVVLSTLAEVVEADERATMIVDTKQTKSMLEASKCNLRARKSSTHEIRIDTMGLSLTVSIVFEGKFGATGYKIGRLAAMLYHVSPSGKPEPIGQVLYDHVEMNTSESMGRLVLRHAPIRVPIATGVYHVVVGCPSDTTYSISVTMHEAIDAGDFVKKAKSLALTQQARLPVGREEILEIWESMRLAERKLELVDKASYTAMSTAKDHEAKMTELQRILEAPSAPGAAAINRKEILAKIRTHDRAFTKHCKLHAIRQEEIRDIKHGLHHLASMHAKLLLERSELESALTYARQHLPYAVARMEGPTAGFKIAYALNADYNVVKTAKMRWRDLAALKQQLPKLLTSAQRIRRKYKKDRLSLDATERQWILLDRILHPDLYLWEQEAAHASHLLNQKTTVPLGYTLSVVEAQLNAYSAAELQRLLDAPYNTLSRKEIIVRKTILKYRDESVLRHAAITAADKPAAILRTLPLDALDADQRAWLALDKVLHPELHSRLMTQVPAAKQWTQESLTALLKTPEEAVATLDADNRRARALVLSYDAPYVEELLLGSQSKTTMQPAFSHSLVDHTQVGQKIEVDIDARCRTVLHELDRAIASTNEFMDSSVLHSAPQRFPTAVLRLELEKELDRLLLSQLTERETAEWKSFGNPKSLLHAYDDEDEGVAKQLQISDSDSDIEAKLAREAHKKALLRQQQKTNKKAKPSYQKQKRAIQDALVPRSIEEQQLELVKKTLGEGGCMACRANPCTWTPYLNATKDSIVHRANMLKDETERVKRSKETIVSSSLCMSAVRGGGGTISMRKADLFLELTSEVRVWEKHLRLRDIDAEFHATFNWTDDHFETVALHGFAQMQQTEKVKVALGREQNTLVAQLTAHEVVEDILEWMLEGWVFGERESRRKVQGYVPSLYKDGPLNMQVLRRLETMSAADRKIADELQDMKATKTKFGTPLAKWTPIEVDAQAIRVHKKAVQKGSAAEKVLDETEQALKFGLFCMTLMYFRGLSLLKAQKQIWGAKTTEHAKVHAAKPATGLQLERHKQELRQRRIDEANAKAKTGQERKSQKDLERIQAQRAKLFANNRLAKREAKAAVFLQRIYRGYLARTAAAKWKIRRAELEARQALEQAAATTMQRAYRGRLGRIAAEERRIELAEFIAQIRAQEAIEEEEAYWKRNRSERLRRRVMALVERKAA
ncbi:hypothetical protein ACHHYP_10305 [Achlya hypogyna]|uniref:EF-hand domain-containing protein n=1 Tax=Achlya hypogyna TaxID=1202772 RepID=A0A1V9YLN8_ACHHY|nr:hypothetical protein ACHHYP_10305 [Achlya hypogyna]